MIITNSHMAILLCSHLSVPDGGAAPLRPKEWSALLDALQAVGLDGPARLAALSESEMADLALADETSQRITPLLERAEAVESELVALNDRGIWTLTPFDSGYPDQYRHHLEGAAPAVLFGAGNQAILQSEGLAVVGSRDTSEQCLAVAESVGGACASCGRPVFSGGARGVDAVALRGTLEAGGVAGAVLAEGLQRAMKSAEIREWLEQDRLVLMSHVSPDAGFNVGTAMARNRLVYTLAQFALVVSSDADKGGTWAGATEALREGWTPVFVVDGENMPEGNRRLLKRGGISFPADHPSDDRFWEWLRTLAETVPAPMAQGRLF